MINETVTPFEPLNRAESNVRKIVRMILIDLGLYATDDTLQKLLPEYTGIDNYAVIDDIVIRTCAIEELAIGSNRLTLKMRVVKRLRSEVEEALGPVVNLLVN